MLAREQSDFSRVVRRGLDQLSALAGTPGFQISGDDAFSLFATHGMPFDLIRDFAAEQGGSVDETRFHELFAGHRELSRGAATTATGGGGRRLTLAPQVGEALASHVTQFLGHDHLESDAKVIALVRDGELVSELAEGQRGMAVFDQTPFYPEGGGQVGDTGALTADSARARVEDTQTIDGHHVHAVEVITGSLKQADIASLAVDADRRRSVMRNHSATHLLHAALREVLGDHVRQAGSLVAPDRLRFDFQQPRALTEDEIGQVEHLVNIRVLDNLDRNTALKPYQDAVRDGAIAFFGEKYGDDVRVVSFNGFSTELCGGTHVHNTAEVGLFRIISEGSIGSGVRRIEALTGEAALDYTLEHDKILKALASQLRVPASQLQQRVEVLTAKGHRPAKAAQIAVTSVADSVRVSPVGRRHVVVEESGIETAGLAREAARLSADLQAVVVLAVPDSETSALRVSVSVPKPLTPDVQAKALLQDLLAVTVERGAAAQPSLRGAARYQRTCPASSPRSGTMPGDTGPGTGCGGWCIHGSGT